MDWFEFLKNLGPYSAPINVVLIGGLFWLAKDRARILEALGSANDDRMSVRDKRVADLERYAKEFTAQAATMGEVVRDFSTRSEAVLASMRNR